MATLKNEASGDTCLLHAYHVFGRDATRCDTVIRDPSVSRVHAHLRWIGGQWTLYDHSSNGTSISGTLLRNGERAALKQGDVIRFGKVGVAPWRVDTLDDPADTLWPICGAVNPIVLEASQILPANVSPSIAIFKSPDGEWLCGDTSPPRTLRHGDEVSVGDAAWRLALVRSSSTMVLALPDGFLGPAQRLEFFVSQNEEHVHAMLHIRGGTIDLGERPITIVSSRSREPVPSTCRQATKPSRKAGSNSTSWRACSASSRPMSTCRFTARGHNSPRSPGSMPASSSSGGVAAFASVTFRFASFAASNSSANRCRACSSTSTCAA